MKIGKKDEKFDLPERYVRHSDELNLKAKENDVEGPSGWKNLHGPSWCPVPFNTISWHPSGVVSRCMMNDTPMGNSHESDKMQTLRKNMLDGKWDTHGCMNCLQKEQNGYKSQRINWLSNSMRYDRLGNPEPYTNPKLTENKITHLFVNFSNLCNFKCRMCSSKFSNSLIPENRHMAPLFPETYKQVHGSREKNFNNINEYLKANPTVLKDIRSIWMTGGEPFMDDSPYELMKLIEKHGQPEKVNMTITTNGSKIEFDKLDRFSKLKRLSIDISIDATGPLFEYMRSNGVFTWDEMKETCSKLAEYKKLHYKWFGVQINASYQMFNYNNMYDFIDFISTHDVDSNIRLVTFPRHLRVGNLPKRHKQEALAMCDKIENKFDNDKHRHLITMLNDLRKAINVKENHLQTFIDVVKEQDKFRGKYLHEYNESLGEIIYGDFIREQRKQKNILDSNKYGSGEFFDKIYKDKIPAWGYEPATFLKECLSKIPKGATILDVGCGTGRNAHYLAENGFHVSGYDLSTEAIQQANSDMSSKVKYQVRNLAEEDWDNEEYDVVIDFGYLHFLTPEERSHYHRQLNKVLKPGGIYINESGRNDIADVYIPGPDPDKAKPNKNPHMYAPPSIHKDDWKEFSYLDIDMLEEVELPPYKEFGAYPCWNFLAHKS